MEIEFMCVGQRVPEWATGVDGCVMEYQDVGGLMLFYFLNEPNILERMSFRCDADFQIAFTSISQVGFCSIKIGDLEWSDCAFSPCIYDKAPDFAEVEPGKGYPINLLLIDAATGVLMEIRTIGLGHDFSKLFRNWCLESLRDPISREYYHNIVQKVYGKYSTRELIERAWLKWSLK